MTVLRRELGAGGRYKDHDRLTCPRSPVITECEADRVKYPESIAAAPKVWKDGRAAFLSEQGKPLPSPCVGTSMSPQVLTIGGSRREL